MLTFRMGAGMSPSAALAMAEHLGEETLSPERQALADYYTRNEPAQAPGEVAAPTEGGTRPQPRRDMHPTLAATLGLDPAGAPTVLLYAHYDVQPPLDESAWLSPPFELTDRDGRWYGRGAADCKGGFIMHLLALRALKANGGVPVSVKVIAEGSEEQGTGGLERYAEAHPELLAADTIVIGDTPRDIACARADGVRVIAVATGPYRADQLTAADAVCRDVREVAALLD